MTEAQAAQAPPPLSPTTGDKLPAELMSLFSEQERARYVVQYNASLNTMSAYHKEPTAANLKNWVAAREALAEFSAQLADRYQQQGEPQAPKTAAPDVFETQKDVLAYLKGQGFKIEKSALSNHVRSRALPKGKAGFSRKAVDRYAEINLKSAETGQTSVERKVADLQERKIKAEIKRLEEQGTLAQIERESRQGRLVAVDEVEQGMVGRALVLEAGYDHMVYTRAQEWIELVGGDLTNTDRLITSLLEAKAEWLNQYAAPVDFAVRAGEA